MPTEKRARQRAARDAKLAAQAKVDHRRRLIRNGVVVVIVAALVIGSLYLFTHHSTSATTSTTDTTTAGESAAQIAANNTAVAAGCPESTKTRVNTLSWSTPPTNQLQANTIYVATIKTTVGTFAITLNQSESPTAVNSFVFLADHKFFNCVIFHRVIPGFVDQTGDPTGTGSGGPGYQFTESGPPVATPQYPLGSVAMANSNSPSTTMPTTNGSQFFVIAGSQGEALPPDYVRFGQVTSGMSVVQKINADGSATGVPPKVTQRMLTVTISTSSGAATTTTTAPATTTSSSATTTSTTKAATTTTSATTTTTTTTSSTTTTTTTTSPTTTTTS